MVWNIFGANLIKYAIYVGPFCCFCANFFCSFSFTSFDQSSLIVTQRLYVILLHHMVFGSIPKNFQSVNIHLEVIYNEKNHAHRSKLFQ